MVIPAPTTTTNATIPITNQRVIGSPEDLPLLLAILKYYLDPGSKAHLV
jgi:hypothetical protein